MNQETVLITGGYGCIGAETAKWLLGHTDHDVVICSRRVSEDRNQRVFAGVDQTRLRFVEADVTDQNALLKILGENAVTHVVHLAALQTPDCNANRDLGLQINLAGTQQLIEAMKASDAPIHRFINASSAAVYGPRASYSDYRIPMLAPPRPVNVYGIWKLAGEHLSRLFFEETGVTTISLRPGVLYGPGRDAGLTSTPTTAMKAVALGIPYEIPFHSPQDYQYAPDIGAAFGNALTEPFDGHGIFTLPAFTADSYEMTRSIEQASQEIGIAGQCQITVGDQTVPFICDLEFEPFCEAFPNAPQTELNRAVRQSIEVYLDQVQRGWLSRSDIV